METNPPLTRAPCNEEIAESMTSLNTTNGNSNLSKYMPYETEKDRQANTVARQDFTIATLGVAPSKQQIISRAVEAKKKGDHRLSRLLAHQVLCLPECTGPHTKKLLERLITETK
jgi:hypothetical protein